MDELVKENPQHNDPQDQYVFTGEELLNRNIKEVPTLLSPIFPQVGVVALAGSSDAGKSAFLRQFAGTINLGQSDFLGFGLNLRYGKAIYVSTEDDDDAISALLNRQKSINCVNGDYKNLRFIFDTSWLREKIEEQLQKEPVDCVIIDAFSDVYDGEMNAVNRVRSFLQIYANLARRYKCLFIFLHHTGKRTESMVPSKDNLLGSQGFEGKMRTVVELRQDPYEPDIRHLCIVKGNYIAQQHKNASYALHFDPESMLFHNIGRRTEFKDLVKRDATMNSPLQQAKEMARDLYQQGMSTRKVVEHLKEAGLPGSKSSVSEWNKDTSAPSVRDPTIAVDNSEPEEGRIVGEAYYVMEPEEPYPD